MYSPCLKQPSWKPDGWITKPSWQDTVPLKLFPGRFLHSQPIWVPWQLQSPMALQERLFRLVLWLYPADFRDRFGDDMAAAYREARMDAAMRGRRGVTR